MRQQQSCAAEGLPSHRRCTCPWTRSTETRSLRAALRAGGPEGTTTRTGRRGSRSSAGTSRVVVRWRCPAPSRGRCRRFRACTRTGPVRRGSCRRSGRWCTPPEMSGTSFRETSVANHSTVRERRRRFHPHRVAGSPGGKARELDRTCDEKHSWPPPVGSDPLGIEAGHIQSWKPSAARPLPHVEGSCRHGTSSLHGCRDVGDGARQSGGARLHQRKRLILPGPRKQLSTWAENAAGDARSAR